MGDVESSPQPQPQPQMDAVHSPDMPVKVVKIEPVPEEPEPGSDCPVCYSATDANERVPCEQCVYWICNGCVQNMRRSPTGYFCPLCRHGSDNPEFEERDDSDLEDELQERFDDMVRDVRERFDDIVRERRYEREQEAVRAREDFEREAAVPRRYGFEVQVHARGSAFGAYEAAAQDDDMDRLFY